MQNPPKIYLFLKDTPIFLYIFTLVGFVLFSNFFWHFFEKLKIQMSAGCFLGLHIQIKGEMESHKGIFFTIFNFMIVKAECRLGIARKYYVVK